MTDDVQIPFDYTNRDYLSIRDQLKSYLQTRVPEWTADPSDFGTVLVEAIAYMGDMLSYYVDIAAQEATVLSSNSPTNVFAHAQLFGYQPSLASSAQVDLRLTYDQKEGQPDEILVFQGAQAYDAASGLVFETVEDVSVGAEPVTVKAIEGLSRVEVIGTSSGAPGQRMTIPLEASAYLDGRPGVTSLECQSPQQTTTWTPTYNLLDHGPNDRVFALLIDSVGNAMAVFGDGDSGAIPPAGTAVVLRYRECSGDRGNRVPENAITQWYTSYDSGMFDQARGVAVNNPSAPVGGVNIETLDQVRTQTVRFARSQRRAVSSVDYARVSRASGQILTSHADAQVWSQPRVWVLPRDETVLRNEDERGVEILEELDRTITSLAMMGTDPVVAFGGVAEVRLSVEIHVWPPVDLRTAAKSLRTALLREFGYPNADFSRNITDDLVLRVIRDTISDDVVRFARVTDISGDPGEVTNIGLYGGIGQENIDYTPIEGVSPRNGYALVLKDSDLVVTVLGKGKRYVDAGSK